MMRATNAKCQAKQSLLGTFFFLPPNPEIRNAASKSHNPTATRLWARMDCSLSLATSHVYH